MTEEKVSLEDLENANPFSDKNREAEEVVVEETVVEEVEGVETEVEVEEETPETPDELDHTEKTKLGRKLADERRAREKLEKEFSVLSNQLAEQKGFIEGLNRQGPETAPPEEFDPDEPATKGDMYAEIDRRENLRVAQEKAKLDSRIKYAEDYAYIADDVLEDNPNKDKIIALFSSADGKYDGIHTGNAKQDFNINLANAERDILLDANKALSKKLAGKNEKVREESPDGGGVGGGQTETVSDPVQLKPVTEPRAKDYLAWVEKTSGKEAAKELKEKHYSKE